MMQMVPLVWIPLEAPVFTPGTRIRIWIPVTSRCTAGVMARVKVIIYEGSILPGHGTKLKEYYSTQAFMNPGDRVDFAVDHTTVKGTIDRRDVGARVEYWDGSRWVDSGVSDDWDDVYYVRAPEYNFEIGQPYVRSA